MPPPAAGACTARGSEVETVNFKQRFIEGREIETLTASLLGTHDAARAREVGFAEISQLFHPGVKIGSSVHARDNAAPKVTAWRCIARADMLHEERLHAAAGFDLLISLSTDL